MGTRTCVAAADDPIGPRYMAHGAVDTTFTQFYRTAKAIAAKIGTLRSK